MTYIIGFGNLLDWSYFGFRFFFITIVTLGRIYSEFLSTEDFEECKNFVNFLSHPTQWEKGCFNSFCAVTGGIIMFIQWSLQI